MMFGLYIWRVCFRMCGCFVVQCVWIVWEGVHLTLYMDQTISMPVHLFVCPIHSLHAQKPTSSHMSMVMQGDQTSLQIACRVGHCGVGKLVGKLLKNSTKKTAVRWQKVCVRGSVCCRTELRGGG